MLHPDRNFYEQLRDNNTTDLFQVVGCKNLKRRGDIIFVHGLAGHPQQTWGSQEKYDNNFWPAWLGEDLPDIGIWSLGYEVEPFKWKGNGNTMPLVDRATNILALLDSYEIGKRPLIFITHSLGGLLVKQMLRHAQDFGEPRWKAIVEQTRGIIFLSTPHSGSDMASWISYIGKILQTTVSVEELEAHHSRLRELNNLYRNHPHLHRIPIEVYCEKQKTQGILVVNETSADPGIKGVVPVPLDCNHISICCPNRKSLLYRRVNQFIQKHLIKPVLTQETKTSTITQKEEENQPNVSQVVEQEFSLSKAPPVLENQNTVRNISKIEPIILITILFDALYNPNIEEAIQIFEKIAHKSLLVNGEIDSKFMINNFKPAYENAKQYQRPIKILEIKPTQKTRIGSKFNRDYGKEKDYLIARDYHLKQIHGHVRIFFPKNSEECYISSIIL